MRIPACIWLCPEDRTRLERLVADRNTSRKVVWRSRIVLLSAEGHGTCEIMRRSGTSKPTVWR
ncbi:MAG: IS630 family transposase, partial [Proteobacteria bacterium]|nr:IS630 family transposase [Pseudomonadota bacterium]